MNILRVIPSKKSGLMMTESKNTPGLYSAILTEPFSINGQGFKKAGASMLVKLDEADMRDFIARAAAGQITGKIHIAEFTEDMLTPEYITKLDKTKTLPENIALRAKKAGDTEVLLTRGGKRIIRFTEFDPTGVKPNIIVEHDNSAAIVAANKTRRDAVKDSAPVVKPVVAPDFKK